MGASDSSPLLPPGHEEVAVVVGDKPVVALKKMSDSYRMEAYIDAVSAAAERWSPRTAGCLQACKPCLFLLVRLVMFLWPIYMAIYTTIYRVISILPGDMIMMVFGVCLCFFGGTYMVSIAAIEAFRHLGGSKCLEDVKYVMSQMDVIAKAEDTDDKIDADHDGTRDIEQVTPTVLAERKVRVAMKAVKEPERLQGAVLSLWSASLSVIATLRLEFARTVALALGIAEMLKFPVLRCMAPILAWALGPELRHWIDTIVDTFVKLVAIIFAWWLQAFISAFYSGLRGGKMFARGACSVLEDYGALEHFPAFLVPDEKPANLDTTFLNELMAYPLAAAGMYFQLAHNFALPFPLNLVFLPLTVVEWSLRIAVAW